MPIFVIIFLLRLVIPPIVGEAVEFHKIGGRGGNRTRVFDCLLVRELQALGTPVKASSTSPGISSPRQLFSLAATESALASICAYPAHGLSRESNLATAAKSNFNDVIASVCLDVLSGQRDIRYLHAFNQQSSRYLYAPIKSALPSALRRLLSRLKSVNPQHPALRS